MTGFQMTHGDGKCQIFISGYGIFAQNLRYFGENHRETIHNFQSEIFCLYLTTTFVVQILHPTTAFLSKESGNIVWLTTAEKSLNIPEGTAFIGLLL